MTEMETTLAAEAPVKKFKPSDVRTLRSCATLKRIDRKTDALKNLPIANFTGVWPYPKMPKGQAKHQGKVRDWTYHPTRGWFSNRGAA